MSIKELIDKLHRNTELDSKEWEYLFGNWDEGMDDYLFKLADSVRRETFGTKVYTRGLIEFTNYCRNDCFYCGIRKGNKKLERYRLKEEDILECAKSGYELGFRTFVLQGGEDAYFTEERICGIVGKLREEYPDCAITLSIGEWEKNSYQRFFEAGANRYLLRHETAADEHYGRLHPETLSLAHRKQCLYDLREIGYQVGTGFMVGSPFQTGETLAKDMLFLKELQPQMVGIGPFIPHADTPFANETPGTMELTLRCIAFIRLSLPKALIPATTALGTINPIGRERGIMSGANVVMPNLSPVSVRKKYELYDNKICTGEEAAECRGCLESRMKNIGYEIVSERGDAPE